MSKYKLVILFFFCQSLFSQKQFVVYANVSHLYEGNKIYYYYLKDADKVVLDSTNVKEGKFVIKGEISNPTKLNIYKKSGESIAKQNYSFFFGSGDINLNLDYSNFSLSSINKNKYEEDYHRYINFVESITRKRAQNRQEYGNANLKSSNKENEEAIKKLDSIGNAIELEFIMMGNEFAKKNSSSYVALYNLFFNLGGSLGRKNFKEIQSAYDLMSVDIKESSLGVFIQEKLYFLENSAVGNKATTFTSEDLSGKKFSLSDFVGKNVILLDFWASWCAPCKLQHPFFRKIYRKYKDSVLEIISISKDVKIESWRETVDKENMVWLNTIVTEETKKAFDSYMIQAIPLIVIIGKNGKIIGRWTGYDERFNDEIEKMISENLK